MHKNIKMNTWQDKCLPEAVPLKIFTFLSLFGYSAGIYISIVILGFYSFSMGVKAVFFILLIICLFVSWWIFIVIKEELYTLKHITLFNERISGFCHFNKKFTIEFCEIKSIDPIKLTALMKQMRLFQGQQQGFDIELKNGKIYHVSPHMSHLESLKKVLLEAINR